MSLKLIILVSASLLIIVIFIVARRSPANTHITEQATEPGVIRYLPLGDSYTIGQSVAENQRWPNQLVARLKLDGKKIQIIANPSITGYTTQNLIDHELPLVARLKPNFVTVLIGVNDFVQGVDAATFTNRLNLILDSLQTQLPQPQRILLVTIPDYGKTPSGSRFGAPADTEIGVSKFNEIIIQAGAKRKIPVADIFVLSQKVSIDPGLTADDGLHPSGRQYSLWTEIIYKKLSESALL